MPPHVLWRLVAFAVAAQSFRISATPPSPPPTAKDQVYVGTVFERMVAMVFPLSKVFTSVVFLAAAAVHLAVAYPHIAPSALLDLLCPLGHPGPDVLGTLSFPFIAGLVLAVLGNALRVWCFKTLGRHFTFEVVLLHDHKLVTDGPYAYVRHPSYIGGVFLVVGLEMMVLAPNGWVAECRILSTPLGIAIMLWLCQVSWIAYNGCIRTNVEDQKLRSRFGKVWEQYAKDVPYKLVPGVY